MNKVYKYDIETNELVQELEINKNYGLDLPFTTSIKPKTIKNGFTQCFNEIQQKWEYIEDNREKIAYSKTTKGSLEVDYLGALKAEHTLLVPTQFDKWNEDTQDWVEDETLKKEYEESLIPTSITQRQCRLMLVQIGKYQEAIAFIENSQDNTIKIEWEYASTIERNNPLVSHLGTQLELTKEQLDNLFIEANKL